jgi:hypothetical protein
MEGRKLSNRIRLRKENLSLQQIQDQRSRHQSENMNQFQIDNQRSRHRLENMNEYQIENQRSRHRVENMSQQQRQSLREREEVRRQFLRIAQEWDDENPCAHCFHVFLKSTKKQARNRCCQNGAFLKGDSEYPKLHVLPETLKLLCLPRGAHFGKLSAKYNKILSIRWTIY